MWEDREGAEVKNRAKICYIHVLRRKECKNVNCTANMYQERKQSRGR